MLYTYIYICARRKHAGQCIFIRDNAPCQGIESVKVHLSSVNLPLTDSLWVNIIQIHLKRDSIDDE